MKTAVTSVISVIRDLGLSVSSQKAEALWLHGLGFVVSRGSKSALGTTESELAIRSNLLQTYSGWLLPNISGSEIQVRRLYTNVIRSMALYGVPIWSQKSIYLISYSNDIEIILIFNPV